MLQRLLKAAVTLMICACLVSPGAAFAKKANARKGKYLYRKHCRACHHAEATGARVGKPLSPISKTQAQWEAVFKDRKNLACQDQWAKRKDKDINDIYAHLWGHAFDSPSPAKCE